MEQPVASVEDQATVTVELTDAFAVEIVAATVGALATAAGGVVGTPTPPPPPPPQPNMATVVATTNNLEIEARLIWNIFIDSIIYKATDQLKKEM